MGGVKNKKKEVWGFLRHLFQIILAVVMTLTCVDGFCSEGPTGTSVVIKKQVWVRGDKVYVRDVADIDGAFDIEQKLGDTYLSSSPQPGKFKSLPGSWLASKIRSAGTLPAEATLIVPDYVRVGRSFQTLQEKALVRRYADFVAERLRGTEVDFRVSRFRVSGNGPLPEGKIRIELVLQRDRKLAGHVSLNGTVRVNGNVERRIVLSGWVDRFEDVVCVQRPLSRHADVTKDDVTLERRKVTKFYNNVLKSQDDVVGKRVKHAVRMGEVLFANTVEQPPAIEKGDRVTIVAESGTLMITTVGIAQATGSLGDQIRVKNIMSNKEVIASIVDSSTVRIDF